MKLNLGCGSDLREGWVNVDKAIPDAVQETDASFQQVDLTEEWPWGEGSASLILMDNVLEHFEDPLSIAKKAHKTLRKGGRWEVIVPHLFSHRGLSSWDHRSFWTRDKMRWLSRAWGPDAYPAHAARGLRFQVVELGFVWPDTLGGWLRGVPPIRCVYLKR